MGFSLMSAWGISWGISWGVSWGDTGLTEEIDFPRNRTTYIPKMARTVIG
jgi:hypothetical protein